MRFSSAQYPNIRVQLESGVESVTTTGKKIVVKRGRYAEFHNGIFETERPEIIEALITHSDYNSLFFGPFSTQQVKDGSFRVIMEQELNKSRVVASSVVPDVDAIAAQGAKNALANAPRIINTPVNETMNRGTNILKARDIIERQTAELKKEADQASQPE